MTERKYGSWRGGKGSASRNGTNRPAYALGLQLIELEKEHGRFSPEYKQALAAWRKAVADGQR